MLPKISWKLGGLDSLRHNKKYFIGGHFLPPSKEVCVIHVIHQRYRPVPPKLFLSKSVGLGLLDFDRHSLGKRGRRLPRRDMNDDLKCPKSRTYNVKTGKKYPALFAEILRCAQDTISLQKAKLFQRNLINQQPGQEMKLGTLSPFPQPAPNSVCAHAWHFSGQPSPPGQD